MFWIVTAHSTAATTEGNSSNTPSPMVLTTRPPKSATIGAAALRCSRTAFAVPASRVFPAPPAKTPNDGTRRFAMLAPRLRRPRLILAHQAGIADDVDRHN